jgi:GntR family transcriptional regulator, transcriptional repressor for pyruvate dehydrogenase complex
MSQKPSIFLEEAPIMRQSVAEMVAKRILEMVTSRALKPGDQLPPERELAEMLDVSRPSVREAIRGLSILGVLKVRQGGGAFISQLDADALLGPIRFFLSLEEMNIRELYDARSLIEGDVARRAAQNMTDEQIDALEALLDAQTDTVSDPQAFRVADFRFHEAIWIGCGNAFLKRIGESLNSLGLEFRRRASETRRARTEPQGSPQAVRGAEGAGPVGGGGRGRGAHAERLPVDRRAGHEGEGDMTARIGVVGIGWWATVNHIPTIRDCAEAEVVAICDLDAERLRLAGRASASRRGTPIWTRCWPGKGSTA